MGHCRLPSRCTCPTINHQCRDWHRSSRVPPNLPLLLRRLPKSLHLALKPHHRLPSLHLDVRLRPLY